jgi:hypothetical protein
MVDQTNTPRRRGIGPDVYPHLRDTARPSSHVRVWLPSDTGPSNMTPGRHAARGIDADRDADIEERSR